MGMNDPRAPTMRGGRMRELPPNHRSDLRHFLSWTQPVQPCHQRGVQARRNRDSR